MRGDQEGCPRNTKWGLFLLGVPRPPARSFSLETVLLVVPFVLSAVPSVSSAVILATAPIFVTARPWIRGEAVIVGQKLKYALISGRAASLYLRWHNRPISHPRRGPRADISSPVVIAVAPFGAVISGTLFVMRIICLHYSAGSNSWKESVTVGTNAKLPCINLIVTDFAMQTLILTF